MAILVTDPILEKRLCLEREASGADRYDEVWEGIYVMAPMPNDEHQFLVSRLGYILEELVGVPGKGQVRPGVNLSDQKEDWKRNYRVPDVAVFLRDGDAVNLETHWCGAADFLIEIVSPNDKTHDKIPFYSRLGVRELLLIDRDPWSLELLRYQNDSLRTVGKSDLTSPAELTSSKVPLTFQLLAGSPRPQIEVKQVGSDRNWLV